MLEFVAVSNLLYQVGEWVSEFLGLHKAWGRFVPHPSSDTDAQGIEKFVSIRKYANFMNETQIKAFLHSITKKVGLIKNGTCRHL